MLIATDEKNPLSRPTAASRRRPRKQIFFFLFFSFPNPTNVLLFLFSSWSQVVLEPRKNHYRLLDVRGGSKKKSN